MYPEQITWQNKANVIAWIRATLICEKISDGDESCISFKSWHLKTSVWLLPTLVKNAQPKFYLFFVSMYIISSPLIDVNVISLQLSMLPFDGQNILNPQTLSQWTL